jgi:hypothetical protein
MTNGVWDSIHVFQVEQSQKKNTFEYKLTTTVMVLALWRSHGVCVAHLMLDVGVHGGRQ